MVVVVVGGRGYIGFLKQCTGHLINSKIKLGSLGGGEITSVTLTLYLVSIKCTIDRQFKSVAVYLTPAILCGTSN